MLLRRKKKTIQNTLIYVQGYYYGKYTLPSGHWIIMHSSTTPARAAILSSFIISLSSFTTWHLCNTLIQREWSFFIFFSVALFNIIRQERTSLEKKTQGAVRRHHTSAISDDVTGGNLTSRRFVARLTATATLYREKIGKVQCLALEILSPCSLVPSIRILMGTKDQKECDVMPVASQ